MNVQELQKTPILQNSSIDRVERESSVSALLLRLRFLTSISLDLPLSISYRLMLSPPDFATLYLLVLHLTRLEN